MEITAVTAILTGVKNATDIAKLIKDSGASLEAAEVNLKLVEIISALTEAKIEISVVKEVILEKDEEIKRLQAQINLKEHLIWEEPYYFVLTENGNKDGPYCQKCNDSDKKLIRLQSPNKNGYWKCNECNTGYKDSTFKDSDDVFYKLGSSGGVDFSGY